MPFVLIVLLAFLLLSLPCRASADAAHPLQIAVMTDPHYISPALTDRGDAFMRVISRADGKVMRYSEELLSAFIDNLLQNPPDVLVIPGDLTFNGALQSHEDLARRLEPLQDAGIRVFVIPGNHDLRYSQAARFEGTAITRVQSPDAVAFEEIWHGFGLDTALSRDSHSLSYMAELSPGLRLLMLDVNTTAAPVGLLKETLSWAKQALLQARRDGARVISCSHQTLLQHNSLFEKGFRMENAEPLLALLESSSVLLHLSGHMHIQHIAASGKGLQEIVTSSLAVSPCQYGWLEVSGEKLHYVTRKTPVSQWARKKGISNPDLLDFNRYALSFFASSMIRQASPLLGSDSASREALLWLTNINIGYFSGRLAAAQPSPAAMRILHEKAPFWAVYAKSFESDLGRDYNELEFSFGR